MSTRQNQLSLCQVKVCHLVAESDIDTTTNTTQSVIVVGSGRTSSGKGCPLRVGSSAHGATFHNTVLKNINNPISFEDCINSGIIKRSTRRFTSKRSRGHITAGVSNITVIPHNLRICVKRDQPVSFRRTWFPKITSNSGVVATTTRKRSDVEVNPIGSVEETFLRTVGLVAPNPTNMTIGVCWVTYGRCSHLVGRRTASTRDIYLGPVGRNFQFGPTGASCNGVRVSCETSVT